MKKTILFAVLFSLLTETAALTPAHAQGVETVAKVSKLAALKNLWPGVDPKFVTALTLMIPLGWVVGEVGMPHVIKGLCALESKTSGRMTWMPKKETCNLYYGDATLNSCQVANEGVALMFPNGESKDTSIRFVGNFKDGKLKSVSQSLVTVDKKKGFQQLGLPVEAQMDSTGAVVEALIPYPGTVVHPNAASEDEADAIQFYNEVASVMRLAYTDCSQGKYEKTMQDIIKKHSGKNAAQAGTKK